MLEKVKSQLVGQNIDYSKKKFLLAVSGGKDSMALFYAFSKLNIDIQIAHVNYNLRGRDSIKDKILVEATAKNLGYQCHILELNPESSSLKNRNLQAEARDIRYKFFNEIILDEGIDYLITAHHQNDQIENILINTFRGIGPKTMKIIEQRHFRPLLGISKNEIDEFVSANKIEYREDSSNRSNKYSRNFLRNNIIPELRKKFKNLDSKLLSFSERYWLDQQLIQELLKEKHNQENNSLSNFLNQREMFHFLKPFGFSNKQSFEVFSNRHKTKYRIDSNSHILLINKGIINISSIKNSIIHTEVLDIKKSDIPIELEWTQSVKFDFSKKNSFSKIDSTLMAQFDLSKLNFPLQIRSRRPGDRFYPQGMEGKSKKVKKLMIDRKLNMIEKLSVPILLDSQGEILWIMGIQRDYRFLANIQTKNILLVKITMI